MAHTIRIQWLEGERVMMVHEVEAGDDIAAWRVFRRLCEVVKPLLTDEARRQEVKP